jgi:serine O-acetyltransferase
MFKSDDDPSKALLRERRARHPSFRHAVVSDARLALMHRYGPPPRRGAGTVLQILWLCWSSDAFLGQAIYRIRAALQRRGVPILPQICHRLSIAIAGINIGDPVIMQAGVHILHGKVVLDGVTEIRTGVVIGPFVSIGLISGSILGPTIEEDVMVGANSSVLGELTVGKGATIGANAAVFRDVPAGARVVPAAVAVVGPRDETGTG